MFTDAYQKCAPEEIEALLARMNDIYPDHGFRAQGLAVLRKTLGFYPGALYYDVTQADISPSRSVQIVVGKKSALILDGNLDRLHQFNLGYPLALDRNQVLDYARFFFAHVIGPHGQTVLVDTVEDINFREEPTPALRKTLNEKIVPLTLNASLTDGGYQLRGSLLIKSTLYNAIMDIDLTGIITAQPNRVLAEVLPINDMALEG